MEKIDKVKVQLMSQESSPPERVALEQELQDELRRLRQMSDPIQRVRTTYPIVGESCSTQKHTMGALTHYLSRFALATHREGPPGTY